jgi:phosphoglycerol transferase MdoB-like AlkP superfamily enzyme
MSTGLVGAIIGVLILVAVLSWVWKRPSALLNWRTLLVVAFVVVVGVAFILSGYDFKTGHKY